MDDGDHRGAIEAMLLEFSMQEDPITVVGAVAQFAAVTISVLASAVGQPAETVMDLIESQLRSDG